MVIQAIAEHAASALGSSKPTTPISTHPLDPLTATEIRLVTGCVAQHVKSFAPDVSVWFKLCTLLEPPKTLLVPYLEAYHSVLNTPSAPPRSASVLVALRTKDEKQIITSHKEYKVVIVAGTRAEVESCVDMRAAAHAAIDADEMLLAEQVVVKLPGVVEAVNSLGLPEGSEIVADPWCYGCDTIDDMPRYIQFMMYYIPPEAKGKPDCNFYAFPLPFIPTITSADMQLAKLEWTPISGNQTVQDLPEGPSSFPWNKLQQNEYDEELQAATGITKRTDLKPLEVVQRDGPSFTVDGWAVSWQKWQFRVGFNHREGLTIHDVRYDGRDVFHRLSVSEMTVPYGDPRAPLHRAQAFDLGDFGAGMCANELDLGCDCVGHIHYFSGTLVDSRGEPVDMKNVICLHEQDEGIGWKHTNHRTKKASVTRNRVLVVQMIITVDNYEYIFAYKFDQAAGVHIETRATGILHTHSIMPGEPTPRWGNIVSPGVYAPYHQHLFCLRIDPAIDGQHNSVVEEDSVPMDFDARQPPDDNLYGVGYVVEKRTIQKAGFTDAAPEKNRVFKIVNPNKRNPISGNLVGYKLLPAPSQLILAHPDSICYRRAEFAGHHLWVTSHKEGELFAGGHYTQQNRGNANGVKTWAAREDNVENADLVVWHTYGLTHNPRVEDFPVMPAEIHTISLKPSDFFDKSPAIDVPASTQKEHKSVLFTGDAGKLANGQYCK